MGPRRSARLLFRSSNPDEENGTANDLANRQTSNGRMTAKAIGKKGTMNSKRSHDMAMGSGLETQNKRVKTDKEQTEDGQSLVTMPYDIIVEIFERVEMSGAVCLGLTCKRIYGFLKMRHPTPISLLQPVCYQWPRCETEKINGKRHIGCGTLPYLLKNWFGSRYRLSVQTESWWSKVPPTASFVSIKVYGKASKKPKTFESAEARLFRRREDYRHSAVRHNVKEDGGFVESERLLPNPFNMGDAWYAEALAAIRASIFRFDTLDGWKKFFEEYNVMKETEENFKDTIAEYLEAKRTGKFVLTKEKRLWHRM